MHRLATLVVDAVDFTVHQIELKNVSLIDSYIGAVKSITLRFTFSSKEKTLQKNEVQSFVDTILENLAKLGVTLR